MLELENALDFHRKNSMQPSKESSELQDKVFNDLSVLQVLSHAKVLQSQADSDKSMADAFSSVQIEEAKNLKQVKIDNLYELLFSADSTSNYKKNPDTNLMIHGETLEIMSSG